MGRRLVRGARGSPWRFCVTDLRAARDPHACKAVVPQDGRFARLTLLCNPKYTRDTAEL